MAKKRREKKGKGKTMLSLDIGSDVPAPAPVEEPVEEERGETLDERVKSSIRANLSHTNRSIGSSLGRSLGQSLESRHRLREDSDSDSLGDDGMDGAFDDYEYSKGRVFAVGRPTPQVSKRPSPVGSQPVSRAGSRKPSPSGSTANSPMASPRVGAKRFPTSGGTGGVVGSLAACKKWLVKSREKAEKAALESCTQHISGSAVSVMVVGHVDSGKSTLLGHLLVSLGLVDQREHHKHKQESANMGKASFSYAWALDSGKRERTSGVTIDVAVRAVPVPSTIVGGDHDLPLIVMDCPGHRDYVSNVITACGVPDCGVLVVSGAVNEMETGLFKGGQTVEHAQLLRAVSTRAVIVAVNKLDTLPADKQRDRFIEVVKAVGPLLQKRLRLRKVAFVPVSGLAGTNLISSTGEDPTSVFPWWDMRDAELAKLTFTPKECTERAEAAAKSLKTAVAAGTVGSTVTGTVMGPTLVQSMLPVYRSKQGASSEARAKQPPRLVVLGGGVVAQGSDQMMATGCPHGAFASVYVDRGHLVRNAPLLLSPSNLLVTAKDFRPMAGRRKGGYFYRAGEYVDVWLEAAPHQLPSASATSPDAQDIADACVPGAVLDFGGLPVPTRDPWVCPIVDRIKCRIRTSDMERALIVGDSVDVYIGVCSIGATLNRINKVFDRTGAIEKRRPTSLGSNRDALVDLVLSTHAMCSLYASGSRVLGRVVVRLAGKTVAVGVVEKVQEVMK
ncbi:hypothetical protein KIPB_002040 [Kipferlia bialata]|uniref:Tr-type G domain-containing protein n=1 Tax=Kipferlia bialata TaxID=797122 RepID=A0A9K3GGD6_9EUKA|nr:hypothetical protein KIPB_002040 [Kipferlia bialata]|eukprot:g2040.t1